MAAATLARTNSSNRRCVTCGQMMPSNSRRSSGASAGRRSGGHASLSRSSSLSGRSSLGRERGGSSSALAVRGANQPDLNFDGLMATIKIMNVGDPEYESTVEIFLSSRYQEIGPLYRMHKESQLITKEQWVSYWSEQVSDKEKVISADVADKIFDTVSFLAKGKSGITPTNLNNLQKTLPRVYRSVTSSGAGRQLAKFSWYRNGQEHRNISRPSQVLTPQKYEELIARLRAECESLRDKVGELEEELGGEARTRSGPKGCECPCPVHHQHQ